jgi:SAM-dependent methyltransferase
MFRMNDKNLTFYNNLGVSVFKELAIAGGFSTYRDLEQIYPLIKDSEVILEVGAGYGRCIDFLLKKEYPGKIIAIEQSPVLIDYLKKNYAHLPNIDLLQEDIKTFDLSAVKVNHILWMWSGIIDFSKDQQIECLANFSRCLRKGGKVIIDIPRIGFQTIAEHKDQKHLYFETPYGTLNCYLPDENDLEEAREAGGYQEVKKLDYETSTQKKRTIYILTK